MLKVLLKKQLFEIFRSYFYDAKKNKARSKGAIVGYIVMFVAIMVGILGVMFTALANNLCGAFVPLGLDWMYFALLGLLAVFLGAFGSVFNTYSGLYLSKDNDLLLSMPIPVHTIMLSRLLGVYLMGLMYSATLSIPTVIVYMCKAKFSLGILVSSVLYVLLISVFVLTLSCILGWVVAKVSLKLKNKSFITVLISLLFIGGYYFFYFKAQSILSDFIANAVSYSEKIKGAAYPLYIFGKSGTGDVVSIIIVTAFVALTFALTWFLLSKSFVKIATSSGSTEKKAYKESGIKVGSVASALFAKEMERFTSSPNYMLNCGLGTLMLVICGFALFIMGGKIYPVMSEIFGTDTGFVAMIFCSAICIVSSMNNMAASSVSLEGKSLWLAQTLPIKPWQVLRAKLSVQLILTGIPTLFCCICAGIALRYTAVEFILATVMNLVFVAFMAAFDLFLGLKMPDLNWTNEITPIKQGASVMLSLLIGFVAALIPGGVYMMVGYGIGFTVFMLITLAVFAVVTFVLYRWLRKKGCEIFATL